MKEYLHALRNYVTFSGRASRREFWMFALFNFLFSVATQLLDYWLSLGGALAGIYGLLVFLPSLAVDVRRLHDVNRSGWFLLVGLVPLVGAIWLLVLFCTTGDMGPNAYGSDPDGFVPDPELPYEY